LNTLIGVVTTILAQAPTTTQPAGPARPPWMGLFDGMMFPLLVGVMIMYFFIFRSKRNQSRQRDDLLKGLKKGDRVQTIGGIIGNVVEARDTEVLVKVDETSNTKIRFARSAIHRVLDEEKSEERKG
jgi:preprotein translocase subunit YajC